MLARILLAGAFAAATPALAAAQAFSRPPSLTDLAFMTGCWRAPLSRDGVMEELYTAPSANLMLGTTRYLRGGVAFQYEFTRIVRDSTGIVMTPYPGGEPSTHDFRLTSLQDAVAIFEAPEHDDPKRIIYRANADGTRTARIDGGPDDREGMEWVFRQVPCDTATP